MLSNSRRKHNASRNLQHSTRDFFFFFFLFIKLVLMKTSSKSCQCAAAACTNALDANKIFSQGGGGKTFSKLRPMEFLCIESFRPHFNAARLKRTSADLLMYKHISREPYLREVNTWKWRPTFGKARGPHEDENYRVKKKQNKFLSPG